MFMAQHHKGGRIVFSLGGAKWSIDAAVAAQTSAAIYDWLVRLEQVSTILFQTSKHVNGTILIRDSRREMHSLKLTPKSMTRW
jgi:hypothetical protein